MTNSDNQDIYGVPDEDQLEEGKIMGLNYSQMKNLGFEMTGVDKQEYNASLSNYGWDSDEDDLLDD